MNPLFMRYVHTVSRKVGQISELTSPAKYPSKVYKG
jgi:hypothetical protein